MGEQWLPIPHPEFKDLPPTVQIALARAQAREEQRRIQVAAQ
jgi:hypothetical protein